MYVLALGHPYYNIKHAWAHTGHMHKSIHNIVILHHTNLLSVLSLITQKYVYTHGVTNFYYGPRTPTYMRLLLIRQLALGISEVSSHIDRCQVGHMHLNLYYSDDDTREASGKVGFTSLSLYPFCFWAWKVGHVAVCLG